MAETSNTVLELVAQIVSAHVAHNAVASDQLPKLINDVHHALATAGDVVAQPPKPDPATPVDKSVRAGHIVCLDCGKHFSMLKRHLMTNHKLTVEQYRQRWGLRSSYPVVSPDYAKTRSALAKKIGLGRGRKAAMMVGITTARQNTSMSSQTHPRAVRGPRPIRPSAHPRPAAAGRLDDQP